MKSVILIGMPASGKSSVGRRLAEATGYRFIDTDEEVERRAGCTIPDLFERVGEEGFRKMETEVMRDALKRKDVVIATGGGIVLRGENFAERDTDRFLTVFLERPLEDLDIGGNRPLSKSVEALRELWRIREPLYCRYADVRIRNESVEKTSKRIQDML